jgi:hypothetical protein
LSTVSSSGARSSAARPSAGPPRRRRRPGRTAVAADPHDDRPAVLGQPDRDGADRPGVDLVEVLADDLLQAALPGQPADLAVRRAEVEAAEPLDAVALAAGDDVEVVLERGGEAVVDEPVEVLLEQVDDGEGEPGRDERGALLPHVAAVLDGRDDARVGARPTDAELLEPLDQRGLGVAGRRAGGVAGWRPALEVERVAAADPGQPLLGVVLLGVVVVGRLDVRAQEARGR